ncbi:MAG: Flp pilus assembly complex ATPase component TadA [Clostridiales bacterium]|nr:Flp pilus assembly complex ATPase component TadA [Clostridiales bacterium]
MPFREQLCPRLPPPLAAALDALSAREAARLEEIRIYAGRAAELVFSGGCRATDACVDASQMDSLLAALCGYALYSCEGQMAQGYIPMAGGHRAGVCGRMTQEGGTWRMSGVSSVCIRISHDVPGASGAVRPYLLDPDGRAQRVLLLGPPGCGKTTVLRDASLWLAEERGLRVAVADEREELFGARQGLRLHVLGGADKARAFGMLLRSMAPQVIVTDEIGRQEDADALLDAARCGVGVLASAHAGGMEDAEKRTALRRLMRERAFDRYILLGRHGSVRGVYDEAGKEMEGDGRGQLGCGRDGDDRHQRDRLFALGR